MLSSDVESMIECHHYVSKQFPHYYRYTAAGIICGANKILINMVKSGNIKDEYISYFQNVDYNKAVYRVLWHCCNPICGFVEFQWTEIYFYDNSLYKHSHYFRMSIP